MRTAAVGFQCPACVNEGARSTRQGRTVAGGVRPADPTLTSKVLIGINAAVFVLVLGTGGASALFYRLALIPVGALPPGGLEPVPGVADGAYWQLLTSAFTHLGVLHIGVNMLALWILGPQLELVLGRARFLAVYFLSALCGSVSVYWLTATNVPTIGASGAIYGLLGALLVAAIKVGGNYSQLLVWIGINFVITFTAPFISWQGHLGGFVGGALLAGILLYAPRAGRSRWQVAGISSVAALLVLATAARTAVLL